MTRPSGRRSQPALRCCDRREAPRVRLTALADELTTAELQAIGEGRGLYLKSCVPCHGVAVKGVDNPQPMKGPDLTLIVVREGKLDRGHVTSHILFGDQPWYTSAPEAGHMPA